MFKLVPALLRLCTCLIRVMPAGLVLILLHPVVGVPIVPLIESPPRQARVSLSADAGAIFDPKISPQRGKGMNARPLRYFACASL